jgi:putative alpha-1,2-mannosidase
VFSALGFYPVCPGTPDYLIGSPLFDRATLTLPQNKTLTITAQSNGPLRPYIQSAKLNGQPFDQTYVTHEQIMRGGDLTLEMGAAPNYNWGVGAGKSPAGGLEQLEAIAAESSPTNPPLQPVKKTAQIDLHK